MEKINNYVQLRKPIVSLLMMTIGLFNLVAYNQAYAMLNFTTQGERTKPPQDLTKWEKIKHLIVGINVPKPVNDIDPANFNVSYEVHELLMDGDMVIESWYIPQTESQGMIIMFHGYATAKSSLLTEAIAFYEMGYSVFMVDFRGSGGSDGYTTGIGYHEAKEVAKVMVYVEQTFMPQSIVLYGQSMGGVAILKAVSEKNLHPDAIIIESVFDKMLTTIGNRFQLMGLPAFPIANVLLFWGSVQSGISGFEHNPQEYALKVEQPILIMHGAKDSQAKLEEAKAVFNNIPSSIKQMVVIENAGHESLLAVEPTKWEQSVVCFLDALP